MSPEPAARASYRRLEFPPYTLWEIRAGQGTAVALIHGLSGSSRWWSRNIDALAARHLAAAIDLVGFGRTRGSIRPLVLPPFGEVTALLARWLESFGEPVHVIGHSMGGELAIRLAAERPELVRSLVLVNSAGVPFAFRPKPHLRALPRTPFGGISIARVLVPDFVRAGPTSIAVASARVLRGDATTWMRMIRAPTLLVWGAGDPLVPLAYGQAMQQMIAGSRMVVIPRAGHVAMWDNAEEFNRVVLDFFDEVERTPPVAQAEGGAFSWGISGWTDGIAHRQAGRRRDIVLVHGLGMSSAYFVRFARDLFARGWNPVAPDLPGFGESADGPAASAEEHGRLLAAWAEANGIRNAVWVGHSLGCNAVARLAALRPDLCARAIMTGPLWTATSHPMLRLLSCLSLDALREPLALYRFVIPAYWRAGLLRWWRTFRRNLPELREPVPEGFAMIAGARDPIPDRRRVTVTDVPGAHACHFSHPTESADAVGAKLKIEN